VTPKRPKVEPIREPTLFEMDKLDGAERPANFIPVLAVETEHVVSELQRGLLEILARNHNRLRIPDGRLHQLLVDGLPIK